MKNYEEFLNESISSWILKKKFDNRINKFIKVMGIITEDERNIKIEKLHSVLKESWATFKEKLNFFGKQLDNNRDWFMTNSLKNELREIFESVIYIFYAFSKIKNYVIEEVLEKVKIFFNKFKNIIQNIFDFFENFSNSEKKTFVDYLNEIDFVFNGTKDLFFDGGTVLSVSHRDKMFDTHKDIDPFGEEEWKE